MNAIIKILNSVLIPINNLLSQINSKTAATIKQGYIFVMFLICAIMAIVGINMGMGSAKKAGIQLVETTNNAFDIDVRMSKQNVQFNSLMESDILSEYDKTAEKENVPALENTNVPEEIKIVENDNTGKPKGILNSPINNEEPAPIKSMNSEISEPPIESAVKNPVLENKASATIEETPKLGFEKTAVEKKSEPEKKSQANNDKWQPAGKNQNVNILPMENNPGVVE